MRRFAGLAAVTVLGLSLHAPTAPAAPTKSEIVTGRSLNSILPEVKFQGATLKDAFEFLRDVTGANIHVNWRALEAAGVNQDTQLNVRLKEVPLRKVLNVILAESGTGTLTYYTAEGVIEVTTAELADKEMITRVYPVDDLLMEVPDFDNAPSFSLSDQGGGGGGGSRGGRGGGGGSRGGGGGSSYGSGGGGGGGGLFGGGGGENKKEKTQTKTERAEALVTLVRETVRPDIWREAGGPASIRYYNGNLIVTAPRSVHEAIGGPFN
jgi:hypothetical protein